LRGPTGRDQLKAVWDQTAAAGELGALPKGEYIALLVGGELHSSKEGTPGYKLTFRVAEGEFAGRRFWHDLWLTPAALPMAKRDLAKLGITALDQLEQPCPQGIRCKVKLVLREDDQGAQSNRVAAAFMARPRKGLDFPTAV
jgi:hypothetical protein